METLRLDKDTAEKLEAIAAARGETPAQVVRGWVERAAPKRGPDGRLTPEQDKRAIATTRRLQAMIAAERGDDTRDSLELQAALYDDDGLPR